VPQGVAAAEADPDAAEPDGVDGGMRGEGAGRAAQVLQLAGRVFVLTRFAAAGSEARWSNTSVAIPPSASRRA